MSGFPDTWIAFRSLDAGYKAVCHMGYSFPAFAACLGWTEARGMVGKTSSSDALCEAVPITWGGLSHL